MKHVHTVFGRWRRPTVTEERTNSSDAKRIRWLAIIGAGAVKTILFVLSILVVIVFAPVLAMMHFARWLDYFDDGPNDQGSSPSAANACDDKVKSDEEESWLREVDAMDRF